VFTVSHDIGSCLAPLSLLGSVFLQHFGNALSNREVLLYLENATDPRLLARARAAPCFDAAKDIVIPPFIGERDSFAADEVAGLRHGGAGNFDRRADPSRADRAVYFRGSVHQHPSYSSGVRQALCSSLSSSLPNGVELSSSCSPLPSASAYWRELSAAAYCPSPGGWVGWSPRTYQAIAAGCAPVLFLGEGERLPFRDVVDWAEFAVLLPAGPAAGPANGTARDGTARDVTAELRAALDAETGEDLARRRKAMAGAWRSFTYGRDPRRTGMREAHRLVALVEYEGGGAGRRTTAVVESGGRGGAFELVLEELGRRL
jgi:hypothetical protein